jgi:hypothetical protein
MTKSRYLHKLERPVPGVHKTFIRHAQSRKIGGAIESALRSLEC